MTKTGLESFLAKSMSRCCLDALRCHPAGKRRQALLLARIFRIGTQARIPKGFRPKAQGCEERATLGNSPAPRANPERIVALLHPEHREAEAATLSGLDLRPRSTPRVARSSQPWAGGLNPFGIEMRVRCRASRRTPYASRDRVVVQLLCVPPPIFALPALNPIPFCCGVIHRGYPTAWAKIICW